MRKKRDLESDEHRKWRTELATRARNERADAEDKALDAAVRNSIKQHGA